MYYEESIIDGVLHIRSTPNGEWRKLSAEAITLKYMEAKREVAKQTAKADVCQSCGNRTFKPAITDPKIEVCVACGVRR